MAEYIALQRAARNRQFPNCENVFFWHREDCEIGGELGHGGNRTTPGAPIIDFRASWTKAAEAAGYPNLLFHDLRRSAVRNMVENAGLSEKRAMEISGHKTREVFMRYNIVNAADVKASGAKMEEWMAGERAKTNGSRKVKAAEPASPHLGNDVLEQLERYASLRTKGLLTEKEFRDFKKKLLGA